MPVEPKNVDLPVGQSWMKCRGNYLDIIFFQLDWIILIIL